MSTIKVNHPHSFSKDEAKQRLGSFEDTISKYGAKLVWKGHKADLKGTGVSGGAEVSDRNVDITVKLGFLAKAAGVDPGKLEASIKKRLVQAFDETA